MSSKTFRIGIGQIPSVQGDVTGNSRLIADCVDRARDLGIEHLVFPELALTGYYIDRSFTHAARRLDSPEIQELKPLSRHVDLTVGFIEETPSALFYNSSLHLSRGRIISLHRKIYPPTYGRFDERRYFGAGWDVSAYDTPFARMAMLICGDAWHLPLAYLAAHDGADVLLVLAASTWQGLAETTPCHDAWRWMCQSYALTLSCFVVFANFPAGDPVYDFWGGSFIVGPDGNLIVESQTGEPDLPWADLDPAKLRFQRVQLPFRRDDSLAHTVQLGQRILKAKVRRDRFYGEDEPQDVPPIRPR